MVKSAQQQATRPVPVYATTGPASWALAYELAAFLVDYDGAGEGASGGDPAETRPLRVALVDTVGHVENAGGEGSSLGAGMPALLRDARRRMSVLACPAEGDAQGVAEVQEILGRLGPGFDALVVCCGPSSYGRRWLLAADGVAVCGAPGGELQEVTENTTSAFSAPRPEGEYPAVVLAPIGGTGMETGLGYPAYPLPRARESADFQPALGPLLEGLFEATGRRPSAATGGVHTEDTSTPPAGRRYESRQAPPSGPRHAAGPRQTPRRDRGAEGQDERQDVPQADASPNGSATTSTPEALERRLRVSLRETTIGGFSRVCVGSPKGGVGKSSIAYAVAGSVAYYTNMRVCLVDADPNFGSTRLLVPTPVESSVVNLAEASGEIGSLSELRRYVSQNEQMRLDVVLGPEQAHEITRFEDLGEAYGRIDAVLSKFYDLVVYDLGLGFRDPAIRRVLGLCNELIFVSDSEVIPNAMLADAIQYVANLGVDLGRTTLALNHRLPPSDESAAAEQVRTAHQASLRRVTEVPYDARMSQMLNRRAFHVEDVDVFTRLGVLTTVAACLEGLREAKTGTKAAGDRPPTDARGAPEGEKVVAPGWAAARGWGALSAGPKPPRDKNRRTENAQQRKGVRREMYESEPRRREGEPIESLVGDAIELTASRSGSGPGTGFSDGEADPGERAKGVRGPRPGDASGITDRRYRKWPAASVGRVEPRPPARGAPRRRGRRRGGGPGADSGPGGGSRLAAPAGARHAKHDVRRVSWEGVEQNRRGRDPRGADRRAPVRAVAVCRDAACPAGEATAPRKAQLPAGRDEDRAVAGPGARSWSAALPSA